MDNKRITLDDLLRRKEQSQDDKLKIVFIHSNYLNGDLEVRKMRSIDLMKSLDRLEDINSPVENLEFSVNLIYNHCPLFKDKSLQDEYECVEPTDIIYKVFDDNIGEIGELANSIMGLYGINDNVQNKLKN